MSTPRERQLAEGIRNRLIAIQKSEEVYEHLSQWQKKVVRMSEREISRIAVRVAASVECYAGAVEKRTKKPPSLQLIKRKIAEELENL